MSEFTETYHLRSDQQLIGLELLDRAGLHGYVFPPQDGWMMVLAEGRLFADNLELVTHNRQSDVLMRIIYAEDHGWFCEFFAGPQRAAAIQQSWDTHRDFKLTEDFVNVVSSLLDLTAEQQQELNRAVEAIAAGSEGIEAVNRFARVIQLGDDFRNNSYDQVAAEYNEQSPDFAGAREILPNRSFASKSNPLNPNRELPEYLFPRALYGDQATTRRAIRKMVKQAWKQGSWLPVVQEADLVPFSDFPGEIYIEACPMYLKPQAPAWRLYDFNRALMDACTPTPGSSDLADREKRYRTMISEGMTYLWFTIGLLNSDLRKFSLVRDRGHYEEVCREMLVAYVRWLPEIQLLAPRIRNMSSFISTRQEVWSNNLAHVAAIAGWEFDSEIFQEQFGSRNLAYLLHEKVIVPVGDRYEVSPQYHPRS